MALQNVIFSTYMYNCIIDTSQLFSPTIYTRPWLILDNGLLYYRLNYFITRFV